MKKNKDIVRKYNSKYDVMHIFISDDGLYIYDEDYPGIYVARNDNNEIEKFTIMDWSVNKKLFKEKYPEYKETLS